jgi:hypothetical protein
MPGSTLADSPPALFHPEPDAQNGLSLARNGCASRRHHSGVGVPGLPLRISVQPVSSPFGPALHSPGRFAPATAASTPRARCRHSAARRRPCPASPLPSGVISPSGSTRSTPVQPTGPACRPRPISLRSPLPSSCGLPAADHRSRFATLPLATISVNWGPKSFLF